MNDRIGAARVHAALAAGILWLLMGLGACRADEPASLDPSVAGRQGEVAGHSERLAAPTSDTVVAVAATGTSISWPGRVVVGGARAVVAAPLPLRIKRFLVLPGDVVSRGAPIAEVAIPEVAQAAATLRGARARRGVSEKRRDWLSALRREGVPRVADELMADAELAELDAAIASATALLRVVDLEVNDAVLDELATRGAVIVRAPIAGSVIAVGDVGAAVVVGAIVQTGTVLSTLAADGSALERVRVVVRLPVGTPTPPTATALLGPGVPLVALPARGPVDLQDGSSDRVFAIGRVGGSRDGSSISAAELVDGQGLTVTLPLATTSSSAEPGSSTTPPAPVRLPASAVRLSGDGVAEVAEVRDGGIVRSTVSVLGRIDNDLIVAGVAAGLRLKRDARAALSAENDSGEHAH